MHLEVGFVGLQPGGQLEELDGAEPRTSLDVLTERSAGTNNRSFTAADG